MAERIFNIEKFQSYWDSLSVEQRSPGGSEIQLVMAEEGTQIGFAGQDGNAVVLPWLFASDEAGAALLLQVLQQFGIPTGELDDYLIERIEGDDAIDESYATADAGEEPDPDRETQWVPHQPQDSTASIVGKTLLKTVAIVGGVYMAYRMTRRPWA